MNLMAYQTKEVAMNLTKNKSGKTAFIATAFFFFAFVLIYFLDKKSSNWSAEIKEIYFLVSAPFLFLSGVVWILLISRYFFKKFKLI